MKILTPPPTLEVREFGYTWNLVSGFRFFFFVAFGVFKKTLEIIFSGFGTYLFKIIKFRACE
jgi:hypothetical protein